MALPAPLAAFFHDNNDLLLASSLTLALVLLVCVLVLLGRVARLNRLYTRLTRGTSGGNLEEILLEHLDIVRGFADRVAQTETETARLDRRLQGCYQYVGMVRFDAFEDVGGEQSFAVALLDAEQNGIVLSSVYSRNDARVYSKSLVQGRSQHQLSREEQSAIAQALEQARGLRNASAEPALVASGAPSGKGSDRDALGDRR